MTELQAIEALDGLHSNDPESAHDTADEILLELLRANGFTQVADAWQQACDRCGFWYA